MKTQSRVLFMSSLFVPALVACGGGPSFEAEQRTPPPGPVERTIVNIAADGTRTVRTDWVTREEQQAEVAAHEGLARHGDTGGAVGTRTQSLAITRDPGCSPYSLKLFSQTGYQGSYICFNVDPNLGYSGHLLLGDYCRVRNPRSGGCAVTWQQSVRSFWTGAGFIAFLQGPGTAPGVPVVPGCEGRGDLYYFLDYEARASVSWCVAEAKVVDVNIGYL